jgi:putative ABC transport system ATP-binding protein
MGGLSGEVRELAFAVDAVPHGRQKIIDIAALSFQPGRMTALSGPSGSGKSTLLYLLAGLLVPDSGQILWDGFDLARERESARDRWRLRHAGFVFQSFNLIDELSPLENVLVTAWFASSDTSSLRQRAGELLDRFGVPRERRRSVLLSNGEQQRVAIARALLFDPKIVFADEPTASLDARSGLTIAETLRDLATIQGKTVIVASHDQAVLALADRTIALDHGRVVPERIAETTS